MARYSNAQLQSLWIKAGGNPRSAPLAAAVALGESGGDPNNLGDGGQSHGLWQVYTPAHPNYSARKLHDPLYNARAAVAISSNGRNWQPWTVFNQGIYRQFLTGAKTAPIPGITDPPRPKAPKVMGVQAAAGTATQTSQASLAAQMAANANAARTAGTQLAPIAAASPLPDPGFSRALRVPGGGQLPQLGPPTPPEPVAMPAMTAAAGASTTGLASQMQQLAPKVAKPKVSPILSGNFNTKVRWEGATLSAPVARILTRAKQLGWRGTVSDKRYGGYRSRSDQAYLYRTESGPVAAPGTSFHETGRAVDVTEPEQLARIIRRIPEAKGFVWAGSADPVHFSFRTADRW